MFGRKFDIETKNDKDFEILIDQYDQKQILWEFEQNDEFLKQYEKDMAQWEDGNRMLSKQFKREMGIARRLDQNICFKKIEYTLGHKENQQAREEIQIILKKKQILLKESQMRLKQLQNAMGRKQKEWEKRLEHEENEKKIDQGNEENVVIEVEESDDKNEDGKSLQDCDEKSDNKIRLERFLNAQSKAFDNPKFSDFRIICDKKEFNVHRVILGLHSDLLLNHSTQDSQNSSSITLKDLDVNLVEKMLKFMYSGKVEGLEKNAHDLFLMARKFGVKELEKLCLKTITKKITPSNVLNCLRLAFRFDLNELKQSAIFYVCTHIQEVQENKEWEEFAKENGEIVAAILKSVSERRDFSVGQSQGPVISMPGVQNQGPGKMTTNHCPPVPMPPVFVPQNQLSQKQQRQTKLQALSRQAEKSQGLSGKMLHNPSLFNSLPPVPISQSQGQILPEQLPSINSFEELPPYLPFGQLPPLTILEQMPTQILYNGPIPQSQCQSVLMPMVSVSQNYRSSVPKNQPSPQDAENLKTLQAMMREAENQKQSVSKNQGTSASWGAENLKQHQDMMEAAKNAHRVFEAAELYNKSFPSPQIPALPIPLPNPMMYPVFQGKYQDQQKEDSEMPENQKN